MIIYFHEYDLRMQKSEADNVNYYVSQRAPAIINRTLTIGRVDRYGDKEVYLNISLSSLKEFEI